MPLTSENVAAFMADLAHPLKPAISAMRELILTAAPGINETIKWNAPSFFTHEHFATFNLRGATSFQVVWHRGAKKRPALAERLPVAAAAELPLRWPSNDRALLIIASLEEVQQYQVPIQQFAQEWLTYL